jgi:multidrug efflux pump subunit AcrA (membrane-fusion protein)
MSSARKLVVAFLAVAMTSLALGFVGARAIRSPAQVVADAKPPELTTLTARVEKGALVESVVFRGVVTMGSAETIAPPADGLVTNIRVSPGQTIRAGHAVFEINDRPVFVLQSRVPLYRDLTANDTGPDVSRLQVALRDTGLDVGDTDGIYGPTTQSAIAELYARAGYAAPTTQPPADKSLRSLASIGGAGTRARPASNPAPAVRKSEIILVPTLPATVSSLGVSLGLQADKASITLSTSPPRVDARVNPIDADSLRVGQRVTCESDDASLRFTGTITHIGSPTPSTTSVTTPITVKPRRGLALKWAGEQLRVSAESTQAKHRLIVPSAAIYTRTDGSEYVQVHDGTTATELNVDVIAEADGRTSISPREGNLVAGDRVVVGVS